MNSHNEDLLTPAEAARTFGVSTTTLLRWVRIGKLHAITLPGGHHRYRRDDVNKLMDNNGDSA